MIIHLSILPLDQSLDYTTATRSSGSVFHVCAPVLLSHRSKMIGTGTSPSSSCRHYLCLLGSFSVILVCGALTFSHLERGPEVQIRFELSERKQEFAKKFKVNGDSPTFYSYCKASK